MARELALFNGGSGGMRINHRGSFLQLITTPSKIMSKMERQHEQRLAILAELMRLPENKECMDCGAKGPKWASWSLGVFLCINCAGIHRSLGTHISKVKSATLDKWTDEQIENMRNTGNGRAKLLYEAALPPDYPRPQEGASPHVLENWIRAKYEKRQYMERRVHKEKRAEPNTNSYYQEAKQPETFNVGRERKPAPPSPREQRQSSGLFFSMEEPSPQVLPPVAASGRGADVNLFNLLDDSAAQQQQQQQQQQQNREGSGHHTSLFANLEQSQQKQKTLDKSSIMSLYHQPIAPMGTPMYSTPPFAGQQMAAPNYGNLYYMPTACVGPNGMPMMMGAPTMMGYPGSGGWPAQSQMAPSTQHVGMPYSHFSGS